MKVKSGMSVGLIVSLLSLALPWKVAAQSALGEMIITGNATVNHIKATSGSTIFSGSEIETLNPGAAIINLKLGVGVLALESNSRVNLSGAPHRLTAQVSRGTVTVRAKSPATVATPQLRIESEADCAYQVVVTPEGTEVRTMTGNVSVRAKEDTIIVKPGERYSSQSGSTSTAGAQQEKQGKTKRRALGIVIPLILGAIVLPLALAVSEGEKAPSVSPTTPRR